MIIEVTELCAERLNMFPAKHGMSSYYSTEAIVTQKALDLCSSTSWEFEY